MVDQPSKVYHVPKFLIDLFAKAYRRPGAVTVSQLAAYLEKKFPYAARTDICHLLTQIVLKERTSAAPYEQGTVFQVLPFATGVY